MLTLDTPETFEAALNQRNLLAEAAYDLLVVLNRLQTDAPCNGPALLHLLKEATIRFEINPPD